MLKSDQNEVQEISLRNADGTVQMRKEGDSWSIQSPIQAKADKSEVSAFLGSINGSTVKEFYAVLSPEQQQIFDSQTQGHHHHSGHG